MYLRSSARFKSGYRIWSKNPQFVSIFNECLPHAGNCFSTSDWTAIRKFCCQGASFSKGFYLLFSCSSPPPFSPLLFLLLLLIYKTVISIHILPDNVLGPPFTCTILINHDNLVRTHISTMLVYFPFIPTPPQSTVHPSPTCFMALGD